MRNVRFSLLAAAIAAFFSQAAIVDANAQSGRSNYSSSQANSEKRHVSRTVRRVATPRRDARIYSAPRGATALRGRYWDTRTRWIVDRRTNSSYAVLSNGEVWFLDPSSGWGYTIDRYGRVYGADPRRDTIYAFSSLHNWRGDLFYFFNYYTPWDGHYTLRDYDYFYSSYYGRRYDYYDYGYAYRRLWDDCDDYFFSRRFYSTVSFHYYEPRHLRYGRGWRADYYYNTLPSVYIAPIYRYQVVNNIVVVNNNYYGGASNGRGLPTAQQAAIELARDIRAPVGFAANTISRQEIQNLDYAANVEIPVEPVQVVSAQSFESQKPTEALVEIPGLDTTPTPIAQNEQIETLQQLDQVQPPNMEIAAIPQDVFSDSALESNAADTKPITPAADSGDFAEVPVESALPVELPSVASEKDPSYTEQREEPVFQQEEPVYTEQRNEPVFQQEEPVYTEQRDEPVFQQEEPVYTEERDEPVFQQEEPVYTEQRNEPVFQQEEPVYTEQRDEPVFQQEEARQERFEAPQEQYEAPQERYEAPQEQYEAPQERYEAPQEQYEAPQERYEAPQEQYESPQERYEAPQERYEAPQERYEAPQEQYEAPQERYEAPQERYEAPQERYEAPQERYEAPQERYEAPQERYEAPQEQNDSRSNEFERGRDDGGQ